MRMQANHPPQPTTIGAVRPHFSLRFSYGGTDVVRFDKYVIKNDLTKSFVHGVVHSRSLNKS